MRVDTVVGWRSMPAHRDPRGRAVTFTLIVTMLVTSLAAKVVGIPQMIWAAWKTKTPPVYARWFAYIGFGSYASQCAYNGLYASGWTAVAAAPGVLVTGVLIGQLHYYGRRRHAGDSGVVLPASGEAGEPDGDHSVAASGPRRMGPGHGR